MFLRSLSLQNFRNYEKADFNFAKDTAIIVGPNTSGKTNFAESIFYLATGRKRRRLDTFFAKLSEAFGST